MISVNQIAHILAGMLGVLGPEALFGRIVKEYAILGIVSLAIIKELIYDGWLGHAQPMSGAFVDFGFFSIGIGSAILLNWMSSKFKWQ